MGIVRVDWSWHRKRCRRGAPRRHQGGGGTSARAGWPPRPPRGGERASAPASRSPRRLSWRRRRRRRWRSQRRGGAKGGGERGAGRDGAWTAAPAAAAAAPSEDTRTGADTPIALRRCRCRRRGGGTRGPPAGAACVYCTGCAAAVRPMGCGGAIWALLSVVAQNDRYDSRSGGGRGAGAYRRLRTVATYCSLR